MSHRRIGKYDVQNELGRGTMGEVYRAFDPDLKRFVALKTMMVSPGEPDETLERFRREARAAALLNHPNIVTVYDYGKEGQQRYIAMELLKGTDLREAIDNGTLKTLDEKLDVMDGVLAALEYAHAEGVVHRDIKPANIHLGPGRHVKLMDFGLARVEASEMTQEGIVLGTPNYMSPEQALGDRVDARTDLFSVGAILFELVTGHKPFEAESTPERPVPGGPQGRAAGAALGARRTRRGLRPRPDRPPQEPGGALSVGHRDARRAGRDPPGLGRGGRPFARPATAGAGERADSAARLRPAAAARPGPRR